MFIACSSQRECLLIRQLFAYTGGCGAEFPLWYLIVISKPITRYVYICNLLHHWDGWKDQITNISQSDGVIPEKSMHPC